MKENDFYMLLSVKLNRYLGILKEKGNMNSGYQSEDDRLSYFKLHGKIMGVSPERAALDLATKHFISVISMVDTIEDKKYKEDYIDEKIGDLINYLLFIRALIYERNKIKKTLEMRTKKNIKKLSNDINKYPFPDEE